MQVRLISYTESYEGDALAVKPNDLEGLIAYCARVSNPDNQNNSDTSEKLIKYLIKNKHWSPLEMVNACLEIETTRDIARQILRHRSFSFQEFSQRYADPTKELEFVTREARWRRVLHDESDERVWAQGRIERSEASRAKVCKGVYGTPATQHIQSNLPGDALCAQSWGGTPRPETGQCVVGLIR